MRAIVFVALAGALVTAGAVTARAANPITETAALSDVDMVRVCEAASNFIEGRELTPEAAARNAPESVYLTFAADADKAQRTVQCRVEAGQVAWHVADAESPNGLLPQMVAGRAAEVLSFTLQGETVQLAKAS